ncbi:MAG: PQQ-binding-like beta-propeller repeat protein [Planctomycetes bacterium]|nr:PQQ-binding-like beta-propeller repeat protein [Planctomycetota bacterium]
MYKFVPIAPIARRQAGTLSSPAASGRSLRFRALPLLPLLALVGLSGGSLRAAEPAWAHWRGPHQDGTSRETGLVERIELVASGPSSPGWVLDLPGRGTPVFAPGRMYAWGYEGSGADLQEVLVCLDPESGEKLWQRRFSDFISDNIYTRYSIGSPAVDPETGNVYLLTTPGLLVCLSPEGKLTWQHSMMEAHGRLTFPNGRTGCPVVEEDLVIARGITANWGAQGPARDRFYAFDKLTGELVWSSTPGVAPKDSSFSTPVFEWRGGKRVFYAGTGCGNVVCVNARTGEPLWRYQMCLGGVNSTVALHGDRLIAIHGKENIDSSEIGRMIALRLGAEAADGEAGPKVLDRSYELWRNKLGIFTSSPVIAGGRIYQVTHTGELHCAEVETGKVLWSENLSTSQLHASPAYADGKLYVPMQDGFFYVIRPGDEGAEILSKVRLAGSCLGSPSFHQGKVYVHTTEKLYAFAADKGAAQGSRSPATDAARSPATDAARSPATDAARSPATGASAPPAARGPAVALQIVPAEVLLRPGGEVSFRIHAIDADGRRVREIESAEWQKFVPPTAMVKAAMDAEIIDGNTLRASRDAGLSAGTFVAAAEGLKGFIRGRVLPDLPFSEGFDSFELTEEHRADGVKFAYPPLAWIGARFKWEVRELGGEKVLAKTLDNELFMRAQTFIGSPDEKGYTIQADVMTDGNRRNKGTVGVINQRYIIALVGNWQQLEVSSNHERIKEAVPFAWSPREWYTIKARVDVSGDGSGVVRGKAWKRADAEPDGWLIEVHHRDAHRSGAPGIFGFSPQSQARVYADNIRVTAAD